MKTKLMGFLAALFLYSTTLHAADTIPDTLKPWVPWVLQGSEGELCPMLSGGEYKQCVWYGKLSLNVSDQGATFTQKIKVYAKDWVGLPGNAELWPQDVKVGATSLPVISNESEPTLELEAGEYQLSGRFIWKSIPEFLLIPQPTGLIELSLRGSVVKNPELDDDGRLWLEKSTVVESSEEDSEQILVYRHFTDEVPAQMQTQIDLSISGKNREFKLGPVLPEGFEAVSLNSPLPAKLDKDGTLSIQGRTGEWLVTIEAMSTAPLSKITAPTPKEMWSDEELWVFEARPNLRLVEVSGQPSIDPRQTTLPESWRNWPAYSLAPGASLDFSEQGRGRSAQEGNSLKLNRTYWLDFDGKGATLRDQISGNLKTSRRLEMAAPYQLGRLSIDGEDQLITMLQGSSDRGVEVRREGLSIEADSRLPALRVNQGIAGWKNDFDSVYATINLPPGWKLFWAKGVDQASGEWVGQWTLLDFFLVMMTALATLKLWGRRWGIISLVVMLLVFKESNSPRWIWLAIMAGEALCRFLPEGRVRKIFGVYRKACWGILLLIAIPFAYGEIRTAMYPILEGGSYRTMNYNSYGTTGGFAQQAENMPPAPPYAEPKGAVDRDEYENDDGSEGRLIQSISKTKKYIQKKERLFKQDPAANVQTGPGINSWTWDSVSLSWQGPVKQDQKMHLILLSPFQNFILAFLRVGFMLALVLRFLIDPSKLLSSLKPAFKAAMILLFAFVLSPDVQAQEIPSKEILDELKTRLLQAPECSPDCLHLPRMEVSVAGSDLQLTMVVDALAPSAFAIPGHQNGWLPRTVLIDGQNSEPLYRDPTNQIYLLVSDGVHQVTLKGPLPLNAFSLPLPMKPQLVALGSLSGWMVDGLDENGQPESNLNFSRGQGAVAATTEQGAEQPMQQALKSFALVERHFLLGLEWEVDTRVVRMSPGGVPLRLEVPLLPGESVVGSQVATENKKMIINMGPQENEVTVASRLDQAERIDLKASEGTDYFEVWTLEAGPTWNVSAEGIPSIQTAGDGNLEWHPWPGENLSWVIVRPLGAPGQTITVDNSRISVSPGKRESEVTLDANFRTSLGGQHVITLDPNAVIKSVMVNNQEQPVRFEQGKLTLTLNPGAQAVQVVYSDPAAMRWHYRTPKVDLGVTSVNANIEVSMGSNRWTLFLWGPKMGPVVLFWSYLIISIVLAMGLARVPGLPLKTTSWVLLSLGLTQMPFPIAMIFVGWFFAFLWRERKTLPDSPFLFDIRQLLLVGWTLVALGILLGVIHQGLLGYPNMLVAGNGSYASHFSWYADRTTGTELPYACVYSLPLYVFHLLMLAWALWISFSVLKWIKWAWVIYQKEGIWKQVRRTIVKG